MRYSIILILIIPILFQCQKPLEENTPSQSDIYNKHASEVAQLFLRKFDYCDCILEPPMETYLETTARDQPETDTLLVKQDLMERLQIESMSEMDAMLKLSTEFDIYKAFQFEEVTILSRNGLDTISSIEGGIKWRESVNRICPEGFCSATKPIFNPSYKIVLLDIDGGGCIPSAPYKLTRVNERWTHPDLDLY